MLFSYLRSLKAYFKAFSSLLRVYVHLLQGIFKISKLKNAPVTIFGGTRLDWDSIYMKHAAKLGQMLAESDISVYTGGGPGIMEAASCGAAKGKGHIVSTLGISVKGLEPKDQPYACERNIIEMDNFGARKWLLIHYSSGFAIFPGGFGTLDELTELLTLIQTKMRKKVPIVLIGVEYWKPFMDWVHNSALKHGLIEKEDAELFTLTDDIQEAYRILNAYCKAQPLKIFE